MKVGGAKNGYKLTRIRTSIFFLHRFLYHRNVKKKMHLYSDQIKRSAKQDFEFFSPGFNFRVTAHATC